MNYPNIDKSWLTALFLTKNTIFCQKSDFNFYQCEILRNKW